MKEIHIKKTKIIQGVKFGLEIDKDRISGMAKNKSVLKNSDETLFLDEISIRLGEPIRPLATALVEWSKTWADRLCWHQSAKRSYFCPCIKLSGEEVHVFYIWTDGSVEFPFIDIVNRIGFRVDGVRIEFAKKLILDKNAVIPNENTGRQPEARMISMLDKEVLREFKERVVWITKLIKQIELKETFSGHQREEFVYPEHPSMWTPPVIAGGHCDFPMIDVFSEYEDEK